MKSPDEDLMEDEAYFKYRVWLRSKPGMYEQYDGYIDVLVASEDDLENNLFDLACEKLRKGSFPDRNKQMWRMDKFEKLRSEYEKLE